MTDARPDLARRALVEGALVAGEWRHFWVYLAGPFACAALGAFAYQLVQQRDKLNIIVFLTRPVGNHDHIQSCVDRLFDGRQILRDFRGIEGVRFGFALGEYLLKVPERLTLRFALVGQPQADGVFAPRGKVNHV